MKNHHPFLTHPNPHQIVNGIIFHRYYNVLSSQAIVDVAELMMGWFGDFRDHYRTHHHLVQESCPVGVAAVLALQVHIYCLM